MTRDELAALQSAQRHAWIKPNDDQTEAVCQTLVEANLLWPQVGGRFKITKAGLARLESV